MYRRNRYYDPATGRFTQEDPIGLAGGVNVYGFAAGDPVNYSDPLGLKVCYGLAYRDALVRATERATGSKIGLDAAGCISSVSAVDKNSGFRALRANLMNLVDAEETYSVGLTGRSGSWYWPDGRRVGIQLDQLGETYPQLQEHGGCSYGPFGERLPAAIAHELLGHAFGHLTLPGYDKLSRIDKENQAMGPENIYHASVKEPVRCAYN